MKKILSILSLVVTVTCAGSCAHPHRPKTAHPGPAAPDSHKPPVTAPTGETSAERKASHSLIDEGLQAMDRRLYDRSADLFQEAVSVDPTNGAGYYYLALVKFKTGEYAEVSGFLEKAETLLTGDSLWDSKIEDLKKQLTVAVPHT